MRDVSPRPIMGRIMASATTAVATRKVAGRRTLHFETIDEVLAEVNRLADAERQGRLKRLGHWTLGQTLGHLAGWAEYRDVVTPPAEPFYLKWLDRLRKRRSLAGPMTAGVRTPGDDGRTPTNEPMSLEHGVERIRRVMARLRADVPSRPRALLGALTDDEWIALQLQHAELHLGLFVAE
jgi:hypothetical protein